MRKYVIAHDVGTSSVKTALVDFNGQILSSCSTAYPLTSPRPGWFEQNPEDYWNGSVHNTRKILDDSKINRYEIIGIVFSTQAMGIIPIDKGGRHLRNNITWIDGRAEAEARWMMNLLGGRNIFKKIIGVEITGKDVLPKLRWLKKKEPDVYRQMDKVLDVNAYLKFRATGQKVFEWSGACSYVFDLKKKDWDRLLFNVIGFDIQKLPALVRSVDVVGTLTNEAAAELELPQCVQVYGGCDDTQSAAMGSGSIGEGDSHIYLGTSAWVGITTAKNLKHKNGVVVLQSAAPDMNLLVGITESAGANLEWLIDKFYQYEKNDPAIKNIYEFMNKETNGIPAGSEHLIFTPWMFGERCPVSSTTIRGTIFNLSFEHTRGHLVNALLEGVAYNLRWIFDNLKKDFGVSSAKIRAIGGGSVNERWMQGIANITGKQVETILQPTLAGTVGAAMCAFIGSNRFRSFDDVKSLVHVNKTFYPEHSHAKIYDSLFNNYQCIYSSLKKTYRTANASRFIQQRESVS